ncbi:MAG: hypothetical protein Q9211_000978 [Gyalolechia sp. 1 TL-2023]
MTGGHFHYDIKVDCHSVTPNEWLTFNAGGPIDFRPFGIGNATIRVTRRENAATIYEKQIHNLNLECFYHLFSITAGSRQRVFPADAIICNPDILGIVITPNILPREFTPVSTVMYAFESIQQLSHHLSIQEMDWELYWGPYDALSPLVASGCLAFDDCGQVPGTVPSNLTFGPTTDIYHPPEYPHVKKKYGFITPQAPSISLSNFADVALGYYRAMVERVLVLPAGANLTMPVEPPDRYNPPKHRRQLSAPNYDNWLYLVVAQRWNAQFDFTLLDIAELINYYFRPRIVEGRLTVGTRGSFEEVVDGRPREPKQVGEWCIWYIDQGDNICERLFTLRHEQPPWSSNGTEVAAIS